jgi:hypothetical protein
MLADNVAKDILSSPEHIKHLSVQQLVKSLRPIGIYDDQFVKSLPYPDILLKDSREIVGDYGGPIEIKNKTAHLYKNRRTLISILRIVYSGQFYEV